MKTSKMNSTIVIVDMFEGSKQSCDKLLSRLFYFHYVFSCYFWRFILFYLYECVFNLIWELYTWPLHLFHSCLSLPSLWPLLIIVTYVQLCAYVFTYNLLSTGSIDHFHMCPEQITYDWTALGSCPWRKLISPSHQLLITYSSSRDRICEISTVCVGVSTGNAIMPLLFKQVYSWEFMCALIGFDAMALELEINTWSKVSLRILNRIAEEAKEDESFKESAHVSVLSNQC